MNKEYLITKILKECEIINTNIVILAQQDVTDKEKCLALITIKCAIKNIEYFAKAGTTKKGE